MDKWLVNGQEKSGREGRDTDSHTVLQQQLETGPDYTWTVNNPREITGRVGGERISLKRKEKKKKGQNRTRTQSGGAGTYTLQLLRHERSPELHQPINST